MPLGLSFRQLGLGRRNLCNFDMFEMLDVLFRGQVSLCAYNIFVLHGSCGEANTTSSTHRRLDYYIYLAMAATRNTPLIDR